MSLSIRSSDNHPAAWRKPGPGLGVGSILSPGALWFLALGSPHPPKLDAAFLTSPGEGPAPGASPVPPFPPPACPRLPQSPGR